MFSSFEDPFCSVASSATLPGTPSTPLPPKLTIFYPRNGQFGGRKWSILDPPDTQKIPPKPEKWTSGGQISLLRMSKLHRQIHLSDTARGSKLWGSKSTILVGGGVAGVPGQNQQTRGWRSSAWRK